MGASLMAHFFTTCEGAGLSAYVEAGGSAKRLTTWCSDQCKLLEDGFTDCVAV